MGLRNHPWDEFHRDGDRGFFHHSKRVERVNQRNRNFLVGLILVGLAIVLMNSISSQKTAPKEMVYSEFLRQLREGKVSAVVMEEQRIEADMKDGTQVVSYAPEDKNLLVVLRSSGAKITVRPDQGPPWYVSLLIHWGPILLIIGVWIFVMRRMQSGNRMFNVGKSKARRMDETTKRTTFADVAGVEEAKEELVEIIQFLKDPTKFKKLGGKIPKGVLMLGPPGTGKTLLAKAVAGEAEVPFYSISGSDFVEMFVGVGASRVRDLFEEGRKNTPCLLFIDEIDAVGRHRGAGLGSGHDEREQTLNQLLVEMDGFDSGEGVIVIAATNRGDVLDPALLRPGRFDRQVVVPLPDVKGREQILAIHSSHVKLAENTELLKIAKGTPGFSGADLHNLVNEGALYAARHNKDSVELSDREWARDKVMMGPERRSMLMSEEEKRNTAYHEAGHALVGILTPKSDPVHKVTIIPRGMALGLTSFLPNEEMHSQEKEYLLARIAVAMGGRAAEDLIFGEFTTGASGDIQSATQLARRMVCQYGMSEVLGPVMLDKGEQQHFLGRDIGSDRQYGEATAEVIDQEVAQMVKSGYLKAKELLATNLEKLHQMAKMLIEKETISQEDFQSLMPSA
ncbi:MAG: ATP-dependent zinc metalloprotease FtsH [Deltaproteobacteria bacterium]|nr:ATP-dependent zinc metalloprotease FtsH [Deltaproteobacteria bacterium]